MNKQVRTILKGLLMILVVGHDETGKASDSEANEAKILDYVESKLAAKDAEIAELRAQLEKKTIPESVMKAYQATQEAKPGQWAEACFDLAVEFEAWIRALNPPTVYTEDELNDIPF